MSGASQAGIGALFTPIIGATSTAASSAGLRSTSVRSSRCPPIEWPIATCGPGAAARQSASKAARSSTSGSKLVDMPTRPCPREPPWPRQSNAVTFQPCACQWAKASRYFSMKSPRPLAKSRLPRALRRPSLRPVHPPQRPAVGRGPGRERRRPAGARAGRLVSFFHAPGYGLESNPSRASTHDIWRSPGFCWSLSAAMLLARRAGATCKARTIPNWLNLAIALLAIPFWWSIGLRALAGRRAAGRRRRLRLRPVRDRLRDGRDGRRRRQAGRRASRCGCPLSSVLALLFIMSVAGGVLTLAMLIRHKLAHKAGAARNPLRRGHRVRRVCG